MRFATGTRGTGVHTGDDDVVELVRRHTGGLQRVVDRLIGERHVDLLAEPLLPHVRRRLAGQAPAVEELVGRARERHELGDDVVVVRPQERRAAVAAVALVRAAGQSRADVGEHREHRVRRGVAERHRDEPRSRRAADVAGHHRRIETERGVDRVRVRLVEIRRATAVENSTTAGDTSAGAARIASRAASTPIEVESSSYDATARVPFPPPDPSAAPIAARCRRQYGT